MEELNARLEVSSSVDVVGVGLKSPGARLCFVSVLGLARGRYGFSEGRDEAIMTIGRLGVGDGRDDVAMGRCTVIAMVVVWP